MTDDDDMPTSVRLYTMDELTFSEVEETEFGRRFYVTFERIVRWSGKPEETVYRLDTTEKMPHRKAGDPVSTLVNELGRDRDERSMIWHGAFRSIDVEVLKPTILEYINDQQISDWISDLVTDANLQELWDHFLQTFHTGPNFGYWRDAWMQLRARVDQIQIILNDHEALLDQLDASGTKDDDNA